MPVIANECPDVPEIQVVPRKSFRPERLLGAFFI